MSNETNQAEGPEIDPFVQAGLEAEQEDQTATEDVAEPEATETETEAPADEQEEEATETPTEDQEAASALDTEEADHTSQGQLAALQDERRKRQEAEAQLRRFEAEDAARKALAEQQQGIPKPQQRPDRELDPEGFAEAWQRDLATSKVNAFEKFGADDVIKAEQVFDAYFNAGRIGQDMVQRLRESSDPVGDVVEWHQGLQKQAQQQQTLAKLQEHGGDLDAYVKAEIEKALSSQQAAPPPQAPAAKKPRVMMNPLGSGSGGVADDGQSIDDFVKAGLEDHQRRQAG